LIYGHYETRFTLAIPIALIALGLAAIIYLAFDGPVPWHFPPHPCSFGDAFPDPFALLNWIHCRATH
jgi:hypothetical protein